MLTLDNLIEDLRDNTSIRKKSSLGNKIFYKNKTREIFAKNNKKNKKTKCPYYLQENPKHDLLYILRQISKNKKNKRNQQERNKNQRKQKILQNQNQKNRRKNKKLISIQVIIINILL
jgi:hypothetical protein